MSLMLPGVGYLVGVDAFGTWAGFSPNDADRSLRSTRGGGKSRAIGVNWWALVECGRRRGLPGMGCRQEVLGLVRESFGIGGAEW